MFGNVETNDASISRSQAGESSVPPSGIARSNTHSIRIFASFTPGTEMTSLSIGVSFASSISLSFGGRLVAVSLIVATYDSSEICTTNSPFSIAFREVSFLSPAFRCTDTEISGGLAATILK